MSIPLAACLVWKAAKGDEVAYRNLVNQLAHNQWFGSYTQFGCQCKPPCECCTEEQGKEINIRIQAQFAAYPIIPHYRKGECPPWPKEPILRPLADCSFCGAKVGETHLYSCGWKSVEERVREKAYELSQSPEAGTDEQNWIKAEKEVTRQWA